MVKTLSVLYLLVGLIAGYVAAVTTERAEARQAEPLASFVNRGDRIMLTFERAAHNENGIAMACTVADISGSWIRCVPDELRDRKQDQFWYSLKYVVQISKREK